MKKIMKLHTAKIKKWDFKTRLSEIEARLLKIKKIGLPTTIDPEIEQNLIEVYQIVEYWSRHIKSKNTKNIVPKNVNLWDK